MTALATADLRSRPSRTFVTDGPVHAIAATKSAIYVGGFFDTVGPRTGPGAGIDRPTGRTLALPPVAGGDELVSVAVPDGSGGFFIGGDFSRVGSAPRRNLAHILADGHVDPNFDPRPDEYVRAILVSGSTVYVGGSFHEIGGETRLNAAAGRVGPHRVRRSKASGARQVEAPDYGSRPWRRSNSGSQRSA